MTDVSYSDKSECITSPELYKLDTVPLSQVPSEHPNIDCDTSKSSRNESSACSRVPNRNIENCLIVWLSDTVDELETTIKSKSILQHIVNAVHIFDNTSACLAYINNVNDELVFLIISGKYDEEILNNTHSFAQINSIYLFAISDEIRTELMETFWKVKGVFTEMKSLVEQLKKDVRQCEHNLIRSIFITNPNSSARSNKQNPSVMYAQLFQQILRRMKENNLKGMIDYCREQNFNNNSILQELSTMEEQYMSNRAIRWYTKENFLYRQLNKALRIQDIDTLYAMRVYIRHLHEQLNELYTESHFYSRMTLYRGQKMAHNEFEDLKKNQGGLIFFNNFLSCSEKLDVAKGFANDNPNDPTTTPVIWVINVNRSAKNNVKFAHIHQFSPYPDEKEWLFTIGSIFRIGWRMKLNNDGIWYVNLELTNDRDRQLSILTQHLNNFIKSRNPLIELGKLMWEMGEYEQTEKFYLKALKTEEEWRCRSGILNRLGMIYWKKNELEKALDYYEQALEIDRQHVPENDPCLSSIYNNLGSLYLHIGKFDLAEKCFQYAHKLDSTSMNLKKEWLGSYSNNIASVFAAQGKYSEAKSYHERSLKIRMNVLPPTHPLIALSHNNLAIILLRLNNLSEAYEHSQQAVSIVSQSLLMTHPDRILYQENLDLIRQTIEQQT